MKNIDKEIYEFALSGFSEKAQKNKKNKVVFEGIKKAVIAMNNKRRIEILKLLENGPKTISELSKHFDIDYKAVWKHVMILNNSNFVILKKDLHKKGRPVTVYHTVKYK
jgi:predicted transcriptional regulator